jgi:ATP-binding cassette, subfamily B (MDR/TAP), member 1
MTSHVNDTMDTRNTDHHQSSSTKPLKKEVVLPQVTMGETLSFIFDCGPRITLLFVIGVIGGIANGCVYPLLAFQFSSTATDIAGASMNGIGNVRRSSYIFMIIGIYAFIANVVQTWSFEIVSYHATQNLRLQWFAALLRQDAAYFDVYDISGIASQIGPSTIKYRRGIGRKFGEGIQFLTIGIGGVIFAMWSSWRIALVVLAIVPFMAVSALAVIHLNQTKGTRGAAAYKTAGSIAYTTVSAIKTVLSLNAIGTMIRNYSDATQEAYSYATGILIKQGLANGRCMAVVMLLHFFFKF